LTDICHGKCGSFPFVMGSTGGRLLFIADDSSGGMQIWSTRGVVNDAVRLTDFTKSFLVSGPGGRYIPSVSLPTGMVFVGEDAKNGAARDDSSSLPELDRGWRQR
jgi:hypothetical protein